MKKTYQEITTTTKNCLVIRHDSDPTSPREWSNLGYFITVDRDYNSPDRNEELEVVVKAGGDIANNQAEHMKYIKDHFYAETVIAIYPITKYEHGGVSYSLGTKNGFDNSNNGFYIITDKTQKEVGTKKKDFIKAIKGELDTYNKYMNGEVYSFCLYDEQGEHIDSCSGFYDLDSIKEHLPDEYKDDDLSEYFEE